jgi:hypothetical protein
MISKSWKATMEHVVQNSSARSLLSILDNQPRAPEQLHRRRSELFQAGRQASGLAVGRYEGESNVQANIISISTEPTELSSSWHLHG